MEIIQKIGLDIDGVIRKFPLPIGILVKYTSPNDIFERANLGWLKNFLARNIVESTPFILNGEMIEKFQHQDVIIITGKRKEYAETLSILRKYLRIKAFYFRGNRNIYEECWKLQCCRKEGITAFYDDRKFVVEYLKKHGVNAIEV